MSASARPLMLTYFLKEVSPMIKDFKVEDSVIDVGFPGRCGTVMKVLKTRIHVKFSGEQDSVSYDEAHAKAFLRKVGK